MNRIGPQRLLDSARHGDDPPVGAEEHIRTKLMQRLALGASSGAAVAATGTSAAATLVKTAALGFAVSLSVAGVALVSGSAGPPSSSSTVPVSPPTRLANASTAASPSAPALVPSFSTPSELPTRAVPAAKPGLPARAPSAVLSPQPEQRDELLAEAAGLQAAHRAIQQGRPATALELLAEQERKFRAGALTEERALVRILALCNLGERAQASAARERFLTQFPRSPLVPRLRALCGPDGL